jgi:hypothetical protein
MIGISTVFSAPLSRELKRKFATHAAGCEETPERHLHVAAFYFRHEPSTTRIQDSRWHVGPDAHVPHM